jgi:asparagine synthase (glutamine-hydrolysing)
MMQCFAVDCHETMYEGIYRLPPGHTIHIKNGTKKIERWWFPEKIEINYNITKVQAADKLKELLGKAIEKCTSIPEETAFELSGGVDSSSVVSLLAQKKDPSQISSYSMDFGSLRCDEEKYVDAVLEKYPLNHQKISAGVLDYREKYSLESLYALSPHWPVVFTFAMFLPMLEQMKRDGKNIIVTGQGGDHLFTGTPYLLYDLFRRGKVRAFYTELTSYRYRWRALKAYVLRPMLGENTIRHLKKVVGKKNREKTFWDSCEIQNLTDILGIDDPVRKNDLDMVTWTLHCTVMDGNIFHVAKRCFGIEYRHPFFDRELVEFALSLPPEMKYGNKTIKRILRKGVEGILPEKIRLRKDKAEFSEVLSQQIAAIDLDALLKDPHIVRLGLLEQHDVEQCLREYENGNKLFVGRLWAMINVEYWYRHNQFDV